MAARSRPSWTPSAWTRAACWASGAGRSRPDDSPSPPEPRIPAPGRPSEPGAGRVSPARAPPTAALGGRRQSRPTTKRKRSHRVPRRHLVHAPQDLWAEVGELVGPHRGGALDGELTAAEGLGPGAAATGLTDGARPRGVRARFFAAGELVERRRDDVAEPAGAGRLDPAPLTARPVSGGGAGALVVVERRRRGPAASEPSSGNSTSVASHELLVGEVVPVRRRDDRLPGRSQHAHEQAAAGVVQFAHHVVEEERALLACARGGEPLLREQQRQDGGALFAL